MSQHNNAGSSQHGSEHQWRQQEYGMNYGSGYPQATPQAAPAPQAYPSYPTQDNGLIYHQGGHGDTQQATHQTQSAKK